MGCKPSTLGAYQRGSSNAAGAAAVPSVAVPVENDSFIDAAAPAAAAEPAAEIPPSGALGGCEGSSSNSKNNDSSNSGKLPGLRLRLVSLKPELKTFSSPRQSIASGYEKIKRGASSLKAAITPRTATPGLLSPREADALGAPGGPHCIASDAIKEADSAACLDVAETKGQAVCGPLHTAIDAAAAERKAEESKDSSNKDAYQIPHTELINKETPSPQQLKSLWMLMKISGASSPQEAMQWLHDLEVVLVTLDPVERQQPVRSSSSAAAAVAAAAAVVVVAAVAVSVAPAVCLWACLFLCMPIYLSVSVSLYIYVFIYMYIYIYISFSLSLYIYIYIHLSLCLCLLLSVSVFLSVCLFLFSLSLYFSVSVSLFVCLLFYCLFVCVSL